MKIYFATKVRGFFKHLFNEKTLNASFSYPNNTLYELNNTKNFIIKKIAYSKFLDLLGLIQVIKPREKNFEIYGSFNRFLNIDRPYFIYVENPTALYHYRINRNKYYLGKRKIKKELNNLNLKALIFMSKACGSTFEKVCGVPNKNCIQEVIYPYVPQNPFTSPQQIKEKTQQEVLKLLFIAQGIRFKSKGGLEIIEAFKQLKEEGLNIELKIITSLREIEEGLKNYINNIEGINLCDFKYTFEELQKIYAESHIFLMPTSDDSFNLTVLESMKSGLPILASRLYAISEMVEEGFNGFLCDPHYWFFTKDNIPNPEVFNHPKRNRYSGRLSNDIICFLKNKITFLYNNRDLLSQMSINSLQKSLDQPFQCKYIINQWNDLFDVIA